MPEEGLVEEILSKGDLSTEKIKKELEEKDIIVRDGPYAVIRHPGYLAEMVYFSALPVVLSKWVPFTTLAALCIVVAIASCAYLIRVEDRFNLRKWGKAYRQYMAEVPAVNFVKGLRGRK